MKNYKEDEFTFGKYKGELLENIDDIEYLKWVLDEGELDVEHKITILFSENLEMRIMELETK